MPSNAPVVSVIFKTFERVCFRRIYTPNHEHYGAGRADHVDPTAA